MLVAEQEEGDRKNVNEIWFRRKLNNSLFYGVCLLHAAIRGEGTFRCSSSFVRHNIWTRKVLVEIDFSLESRVYCSGVWLCINENAHANVRFVSGAKGNFQSMKSPLGGRFT